MPNGGLYSVNANEHPNTKEPPMTTNAPPKARLNVHTYAHEASHGSSPRGFGTWWFAPVDTIDFTVNQAEPFILKSPAMNYAGAKVWLGGAVAAKRSELAKKGVEVAYTHFGSDDWAVLP
jgi:hypothetical protein